MIRAALSLTFLFAFGAYVFAQDSIMTGSSAQEEVKRTITAFFDGFHKQDSSLIKSLVADRVVLQTTGKDREGKTRFRTEEFSGFLKSICSIPDSIVFEEKLTSFSIQVDRTMANAWVGYEFWINGEFSHCGINSFQLVDFDGDWKIIYLIDTRGREGCLN
ncbi:nuclear transport factor 2 family protein [Flagellimonas meishanensis]|uniref:nuclear transport factor 2 family protein n=1 Tax=Flagellimonas meishanensis TaxID=2873264 RepID=UPI00223B3FEE|nr:nuclear transport factor 2 family protein [[Muricauda] meishanensis]